MGGNNFRKMIYNKSGIIDKAGVKILKQRRNKYNLHGLPARILGRMRGNLIEAFWFNKTKNAGDLVTPFLLSQYGFTPVHAWPQRANLFGCGSILKHLYEDYEGYILGSGYFWEGEIVHPKKARILAVRGITTWERLGSPQGTVLGDPGFLMGKFLNKQPSKKFTLGLVPHYSEKKHPAVVRLLSRYPSEIRLIDIQDDPLTVTEKLAECEVILSSSLHGCIFADAIHLPRVWMMLDSSDPRRKYKFQDYISPFECEIDPMLVNGDENLSDILAHAVRLPIEKVEKVVDDLDNCFRQLNRELRIN
jgi:hypothetical protein